MLNRYLKQKTKKKREEAKLIMTGLFFNYKNLSKLIKRKKKEKKKKGEKGT